ncbi:DoxX family protein [Dyella humicola]|uniref:DoxX family protein n=1 Tax=Dyella humicola TaxID=2992126 RepID=UPI00225C0D39|nr:DoxX family protein [Dyella humicola]
MSKLLSSGWRVARWMSLFQLCATHLQGGIDKALDFPGAMADMARLGLAPPPVFATMVIALELGASFAILTGVLRWAGAATLALFALREALVVARFWELPPPQRLPAANVFFEHLGLVGGLLTAAWHDARERLASRRYQLSSTRSPTMRILPLLPALVLSLSVLASPAVAQTALPLPPIALAAQYDTAHAHVDPTAGALLSHPNAHTTPTPPQVAVAAQYDTTHVYVDPTDVDRFAKSFLATFGGQSSKQVLVQVTPTPSQTSSQLLQTPVGTISLFGFRTPVPYPFGIERTGYLVKDMDEAIQAARAAGADVLVAPFPDPIGRDAVIQWPGGVNMQLYWHTAAPNYTPFETVPENRVYVSPDRADAFMHAFLTFSHGKVVNDDAHAPGIEIGRAGESFRRIRIESDFGKMSVQVTDGKLSWPYGRELTGYEVSDLPATLAKATASGAKVLVQPYEASGRRSAMVLFPGGYIAEIHATTGN